MLDRWRPSSVDMTVPIRHKTRFRHIVIANSQTEVKIGIFGIMFLIDTLFAAIMALIAVAHSHYRHELPLAIAQIV